ncbi:MAG TPA: metal-dependent hydrolase, partial [Halococcus sp.]|nr:metal-dependent hydrolase [Halococcus sp.]
PYDTSVGFAEHFADLEFSPFILAGIAILAFSIAVWLRDGHPGPGMVRRWFVSWRERTAGN